MGLMTRPRTLLAGLMLAGLILTSPPCAFALNPSLDVSQYAHTPWRVRDGFAKGAVNSIAQTPDGYLWLGTDFGLARFDGVRSVPWSPPDGQQLPSSNIRTLLVTRDGRLWIGTLTGLASWKDGKLTHYSELDSQAISSLLEDSRDIVWAGGIGAPTGRLCAIQSARTKCYGEDGSLGLGVFSLTEYQGHLWAGTATGLRQWNTDPSTDLPKVYSLPGPVAEPHALFEGDNGNLWIGLRDGLGQLADGKIEPYPLPGVGNFRPQRVLRDRDGGLWIATADQGVVHLHHGIADTFAPFDGLSGGAVHCVFQDREGNIWVGADDGFDRFRDLAVATISSKQGLSQTTVVAVLAAHDGSVWAATYDGLNRWKDGQWTVYWKQANRSPTLLPPTLLAGLLTKPGRVREVNDSGLPGNSFACLFEDDQGRIWVSSARGVAYFENGRFVPVSSVSSQVAHSITEDDSGSIWIADQDRGLLRLADGRLADQIPCPT
jgi:ligand-binding sensor domain-containing protein